MRDRDLMFGAVPQLATSVNDQIRENIYNLFRQYYPDLVFTKIKDSTSCNRVRGGSGKSCGSVSVYYAKIKSHISTGYRYVICVIPIDNYVPSHEKHLRDLNWISLQTRLLDVEYKIPAQIYKSSPEIIDYFSKIMFQLAKRDYSSTHYESISGAVGDCDLLLLHSKKNPERSNYPERVDLKSALDNFSTVISLRV